MPPSVVPVPGRREDLNMYIGFGTIVLIILIVLAFKLFRRA